MLKRYRVRDYDFKLVIFLIAISIIGVLIVGSAKAEVQSKQLLGLIVGVFFMIVISLFDYSFFLQFYWVIYFGNLVLLLLVRFAGVEVNNAITLWETAKKRVDIDKKQIVNLKAAVWNTQLLMKHGNANYLEVLTAQKNLLQVELGEVSDRYDEFQSVVNLYHALGGGY